jgi:hypothetical protein
VVYRQAKEVGAAAQRNEAVESMNLLPEDREGLPEIVPVEWLNLGCTVYRREALPSPVFEKGFTGYSMLEDLALSLTVARRWKLANARTARIFHDSQPGDYKSGVAQLARMELVNRHYVMRNIMDRRRVRDYENLLLHQLFNLASQLTSARGWRSLPAILQGKVLGVKDILSMGQVSVNGTE